MSRSLPEWVGRTDDTPIPPRVKIRVFEAQGGLCAHCEAKMGTGGKSPEFDHKVALANGGENRESNTQALCRPCHRAKTNVDVAQKSTDRRIKAKHLGIEKKKARLPGSKGSGWRKPMNGPAYRVKE